MNLFRYRTRGDGAPERAAAGDFMG